MILRHTSQRTLFLFSSSFLPSSSHLPSLFLRISHFSSSANAPSQKFSLSRRQEEESRNVKVSVWWDFENCNVPAGVNVFRVAECIHSAVRANGIKGPITITAFGDVLQLSRSKQEALSSTGIYLNHVPNGGKNSADRSLLVDLMYWISQNPPPAHIFLISGDRDFASVLHRLRRNNYNILLAGPEKGSSVLCSAASIMWPWHALLKGETLTGKHFNQPPDGPYNSWYGYSNVALESPFTDIEQHVEELTDPGLDHKLRPSADTVTRKLPDPDLDQKICPIPNTVMRQIRQILNLHPKGISIRDLRMKLSKRNVALERGLYGYKKFTRFLLAMPHILTLKPAGDGQLVALRNPSRAHEPVGISSFVASDSFSDTDERDLITTKSNDQNVPFSKAVNADTSMPFSPDIKAEETLEKVPECTSKTPETPSLESTVEVVGVQASKGNSLPGEEQEKQNKKEIRDTASDVGYFRKFWLKWFRNHERDVRQSSKDPNNEDNNVSVKSVLKTPEKFTVSGDGSEKTKVEEKCLEPTSKDQIPGSQSVISSGGSVAEEHQSTTAAKDDVGLFDRIMNRFKSWRKGAKSDILSKNSTKHAIFSEDSFWRDMKSFLDTPRGAAVVINSRNREQMAHNIRKDGPPFFQSFDEKDLAYLVNLLITEKKWVKECPSESMPFKLAECVQKSSSEQSHQFNGLSSFFTGKSLQPDMSKLPKLDEEQKRQDIPQGGVSQPFTVEKSSERSRSQILADCRRLVSGLLKEHPEGFNMSVFRKLFLEKYGYPLDLQKLGYQKLVSLLQIMPGVRIESTFVVPSGKALKKLARETSLRDVRGDDVSHTATDSDAESLVASKKNGDLDSLWEELGPISSNSSVERESESLSYSERVAGREQKIHNCCEPIIGREQKMYNYYEPAISDDEFSDSESDTPKENEPGERKARITDDSSLLQILDSWYGRKEASDQEKLNTEKVDNIGDSSKDGLMPSKLSEEGLISETLTSNDGRKKNPKRAYTFVADPSDGKKDKLIDGILGTLKKSGETRIQC